MDAAFSIEEDRNGLQALNFSLPPSRCGVASIDLDGYDDIIFDQVAVHAPQCPLEIFWSQESFGPRDEIRFRIPFKGDHLKNGQALGQAILNAFQVTDANANAVASGLLCDNRRYLEALASFPRKLVTSVGKINSWIVTSENTESLPKLLEAFNQTYRSYRKTAPSFALGESHRFSKMEFLIFAGPSPEEIYGILHGRELIRGWPVESVSRIARENPGADYSSYHGIAGALSIHWVEAARPGIGVGRAIICALQNLPYELIELEEGINVPNNYYERLGFSSNLESRSDVSSAFPFLRAMTWSRS